MVMVCKLDAFPAHTVSRDFYGAQFREVSREGAREEERLERRRFRDRLRKRRDRRAERQRKSELQGGES